MPKDKVINFRIETELYNLLLIQIKKENISVSNYIRNLLVNQIKETNV